MNDDNNIIVLREGVYSVDQLNDFKEKANEVVDIYLSQLLELMIVKNPSQRHKIENSGIYDSTNSAKYEKYGSWVYYPWSNKLMHCLGEEDLFELRTNRNKNLINDNEQLKLHNSTIGIAGMSVGAGIALGMVYSGISKTIKIADFDELSTTNLNRLKSTLLNVGKNKSELVRRQILEVDPYINVTSFPEGISEKNIKNFYSDKKLDIVIDEIDDFRMKLLLRLEAKKFAIPLLMFTSLGDSILLDVERYDEDSNLEPFNGILGDSLKDLMNIENPSADEIKKLSIKLVGVEYVPTKAISSVSEIGSSLVGRPQLFGTIAVDGGLATYVVRQLILNNRPKSGRYFIKFSDLFRLKDNDFNDTAERASIIQGLFGD